ncbi:hypothetical protein AN958_12425 [Leucoagaricus sp. SymC.cos]|nr:hypothetical protein AN958_12425 [Leucoagaricus sp. SymC.cos]
MPYPRLLTATYDVLAMHHITTRIPLHFPNHPILAIDARSIVHFYNGSFIHVTYFIPWTVVHINGLSLF